MSFLALLWLPILLSAILVFLLSAASHMFLPWRRNEFRHVPQSDAVQAALRGLPPGQYLFPASADSRERMTAEWMQRWAAGPSGWITLAPQGPINMPRNLGLSFLVNLLVSVLTAYVAALALGPSTPYLEVLRLVSTIGFMSYAVGTSFNSIWYSRPWKDYAADLVDALVYGFAMAGVFGWLWPR